MLRTRTLAGRSGPSWRSRRSHRLSAYDAAYLELARAMGFHWRPSTTRSYRRLPKREFTPCIEGETAFARRSQTFETSTPAPAPQAVSRPSQAVENKQSIPATMANDEYVFYQPRGTIRLLTCLQPHRRTKTSNPRVGGFESLRAR